ncbi:gghA [Scenedesmus sp. PABB004]|nr:gghA [Scenedesmus sp. PABB004]
MIAAFKTNTIGPLLVVQQLLKAGLLGGPGGRSVVANVTSKVGSVDDNRGGGGYAYRASKSALNIVNKSMSIDLSGEGVTAVLLHPGYVRTAMTDGSGLIDADTSVAGMLSVLESDRPLNGGWWDYKGEVVPCAGRPAGRSAGASSSTRIASDDSGKRNNRPIVGVLSQAGLEEDTFVPENGTYIAASYVKFVESGGARVVPILADTPPDVLSALLKRLNGVLVPGGAANLRPGHAFFDTASAVLRHATAAADRGEYFPLLGICLGFETLMVAVAGSHDILTSYDSDGMAAQLYFTADAPDSRFFQSWDLDLVFDVLQTPLTRESHSSGVSLKTFYANAKLSAFFNPLTLSLDKEGKVYISTVEAKGYPILGLQWHPEKNSFEWTKHKQIPHGYWPSEVTHQTARFFVNETRRSLSGFRDVVDEDVWLAYNDRVVFSGRHIKEDDPVWAEQAYVFPAWHEYAKQLDKRAGVSELLAGLPVPALRRLAASARVVNFKAGKSIYDAGSPAERFVVILTGRVDLWTHPPGTLRPRTVVRALRKGEAFGEQALLSGACHATVATPSSDASLLVVGREDFLHIFGPHFAAVTARWTAFLSGRVAPLAGCSPSQLQRLCAGACSSRPGDGREWVPAREEQLYFIAVRRRRAAGSAAGSASATAAAAPPPTRDARRAGARAQAGAFELQLVDQERQQRASDAAAQGAGAGLQPAAELAPGGGAHALSSSGALAGVRLQGGRVVGTLGAERELAARRQAVPRRRVATLGAGGWFGGGDAVHGAGPVQAALRVVATARQRGGRGGTVRRRCVPAQLRLGAAGPGPARHRGRPPARGAAVGGPRPGEARGEHAGAGADGGCGRRAARRARAPGAAFGPAAEAALRHVRNLADEPGAAPPAGAPAGTAAERFLAMSEQQGGLPAGAALASLLAGLFDDGLQPLLAEEVGAPAAAAACDAGAGAVPPELRRPQSAALAAARVLWTREQGRAPPALRQSSTTSELGAGPLAAGGRGAASRASGSSAGTRQAACESRGRPRAGGAAPAAPTPATSRSGDVERAPGGAAAAAMSYDEVEIEDMAWDEARGAYTYQCPCGDLFLITLEELRAGEEIARCPSCSLYITVIYDQADFQDVEPPGGAQQPAKEVLVA